MKNPDRIPGKAVIAILSALALVLAGCSQDERDPGRALEHDAKKADAWGERAAKRTQATDVGRGDAHADDDDTGFLNVIFDSLFHSGNGDQAPTPSGQSQPSPTQDQAQVTDDRFLSGKAKQRWQIAKAYASDLQKTLPKRFSPTLTLERVIFYGGDPVELAWCFRLTTRPWMEEEKGTAMPFCQRECQNLRAKMTEQGCAQEWAPVMSLQFTDPGGNTTESLTVFHAQPEP